MENSNLPKSKQKPITLYANEDDLDAYMRLDNIRKNIVEFVHSGKHLYITGQYPGNGKTSWAIKLMHRYFDQIWYGNGLNIRALFISVPMFLLNCKNFDNKSLEFDELKQNIMKVDLVIWDDIGSTKLSGYDYSQLFSYVDYRFLAEKTNIYTGNLSTYDALVNSVGDKLASRIWQGSNEIIELVGKDHRQNDSSSNID